MKPILKRVLTVLAMLGLAYVNCLIFAPLLLPSGKPAASQVGDSSTIREEGGQQVIHIVAKRGYQPRFIAAKANQPTILEFETAGYDCSSVLRIPALNIQQILSSSEPTRITVPPQQAGSTLTGLCSMGMYRFDIRFD
jgi:plastocyanin domain-containing protein